MRRIVLLVLILIAGWVSDAPVNAANIRLYNRGDSTQNDLMFFDTDPNYNEGFDVHDSGEFANPGTSLSIFSSPEGHSLGDLMRDARPSNTSGIDFHLGVSGTGSITSNNELRIIVTGDTGLEHKHIIAYDLADPNTVYPVDKTVDAITWIDLPDLVNQSVGVYATWAIDLVADVQGDITDSTGEVGSLDGIVDMYDLQALDNTWLEETLTGEKYSIGDINTTARHDYISGCIHV